MVRTVIGVLVVLSAWVEPAPAGHPAEAAPAPAEVAAAFGAPLEDQPGNIVDAGAVYVFAERSAAGDLSTDGVLALDRAALGGDLVGGDHLGAAVEYTEAFGPGAQLVVGAPGADGGSGRVYVVRTDPGTGRFDLAHPTILRQGRNGLPGTSEPGDGFGSSLQVVDPDVGDPWLAVGAPGEDVGDVTDAGAVTAVPMGVDVAGAQVFYQGGLLPGRAEIGDRFGTSLAQHGEGIIAAAPTEDVRTVVDAGGLTSFDLHGRVAPQQHRQGFGLPGSPEPHDRVGSSLAGLGSAGVLIGVPLEDIGSVTNAGIAVELPAPGSPIARTSVWYQGHRRLQGLPEEGDLFGAQLAYGASGLLVGVPGELVGARSFSGAVHFLPSLPGAHRPFSVGSGRQMLHQGMAQLPRSRGTSFGRSVGWSGDRVLVGVDEDVDAARFAGAVFELTLDDAGQVTGPAPRLLTEATFGSRPEHADGFGSVLTTR